MTDTVPNYRWSASEFVRAWEAGAFDHRVELVNGEVWPVVIGDWHGDITFRLASELIAPDAVITAATLASSESLPDPDCWVRRKGASPVGKIGSKLSRWDGTDVLLVVEVSDETVMADLTVKAKVYGSAGYAAYWVVTRDAVFEHLDPTLQGYRQRNEYRAGDQLKVPYSHRTIDVGQLLGD